MTIAYHTRLHDMLTGREAEVVTTRLGYRQYRTQTWLFDGKEDPLLTEDYKANILEAVEPHARACEIVARMLLP